MGRQEEMEVRMLDQLLIPVTNAFSKLAKVFLYTMLLGLVFFVCTVVYAYIEGYVMTRSALNVILEYAADENCLAFEEIYYDTGGDPTSVQNMVRDILEAYEDTHWYLDFDTTGVFVGGSDDYTIGIYYTDSSGNRITANSYETVCQRGTVLHVTLQSTISVAAWTAPTLYDGNKKAEGSRGTIVHIPILVSSDVVATREYKGLDLIRGH